MHFGSNKFNAFKAFAHRYDDDVFVRHIVMCYIFLMLSRLTGARINIIMFFYCIIFYDYFNYYCNMSTSDIFLKNKYSTMAIVLKNKKN